LAAVAGVFIRRVWQYRVLIPGILAVTPNTTGIEVENCRKDRKVCLTFGM
jgi:hypothetical protein